MQDTLIKLKEEARLFRDYLQANGQTPRGLRQGPADVRRAFHLAFLKDRAILPVCLPGREEDEEERRDIDEDVAGVEQDDRRRFADGVEKRVRFADDAFGPLEAEEDDDVEWEDVPGVPAAAAVPAPTIRVQGPAPANRIRISIPNPPPAPLPAVERARTPPPPPLPAVERAPPATRARAQVLPAGKPMDTKAFKALLEQARAKWRDGEEKEAVGLLLEKKESLRAALGSVKASKERKEDLRRVLDGDDGDDEAKARLFAQERVGPAPFLSLAAYHV